jgi:predicted ester cyclase
MSLSSDQEEKNNETIFMQSIEIWNSGDLDAYMHMYDINVVLHGVPGVEPGIESARKFYQGFHKAFPGVQISVDDLITKADMLTCRFTVSGTHKGEFMGLPPTGKPFMFTGITILKFRDRKCVERWYEADFLGLLQQLGAAPEKTS